MNNTYSCLFLHYSSLHYSTLIIKVHVHPSSDASLLCLDSVHLSDQVPELSCALRSIDLILLGCACHTESCERVLYASVFSCVM